ncbi:MAG: hypothetical protein LUF92_14805 [Clostridiales bacterium]|nr:hypothetical protein [Clostridiales bacterium]
MNEKYEKPSIHFESFELSTAICGSCGAGANSGGSSLGYPYFDDPSTCAFGYEDYGVLLFLTGNSNCLQPVGSEDDGTSYCYNQPSGNITVFSS